MRLSLPNKKTGTEEKKPVTVLPDAVRAKLDEIGFNGDALIQVQADLDAGGRWGKRYLVASAQRVLVLALPPTEATGADTSHPPLDENPALPVAEGTQTTDANGPPPSTLTDRLEPESPNAKATIEMDVPLQNIRNTEAKPLVGSTALEAVIVQTPETPPDGTALNGGALTGGALNGGALNGAALNGGTLNGAALNGAPAETAPEPAQIRVVELLRSSNAHAKELSNAVHQLEYLRKHGKLEEEAETDVEEKKTCPRCERALPTGSQVCPFCANKWQAFRRLIGYLGPYKWLAIASGLLNVLSSALDFVPSLVSKALIDRVFPMAHNKAVEGVAATSVEARHLLLVLVCAIVLTSFVSAILGVIRGRLTAYLGAAVLHHIRSQLYTHLQRLSLSFYDKREVGAVMSRVQNDVQMLQNFLLDASENIIISTLTIIGVIVIMLYYSWSLALAVLLPVPFVIYGTNRYWRGLMKLWRRVWHQNSTLGARLADTLGGVRVVRAFAQEEREVDRFITKSGELRDATMRVEQKAAAYYPVLGFIMGLGMPIVWLMGGNQVLNGQLTFGSLMLFTILLARLYSPIQMLTRLVNFTTRALTAAERVFEVLDTQPEIREKPDAVAMPAVKGHVEFKNVVFGYDRHRPVLKGIDLTVDPGEMIGLVGHSGAGKSTLINLLMRFYDVNDGALLVDGVDIRDIKRDDLRRQIGVVLQESYLFHGSIFDNIIYGNPRATPAEVMAAAKAAYAHDFIVSFPDGYDTMVGERGTRLSGGERQRISIARAILHNPRILILDEATASVDTETEQQIQKALQNLTRGRTTIAIAHRLSTLRNADRLIVLDHGQVVEQGTHDELMEKHGVFSKLVNAQRAMNEVLTVGG